MMIKSFNNIFIYLFIILFFILLLFKLNTKKLKNNESNHVAFIIYLHNSLRNNNISYSYFIFLLYIATAVLPFVIFRFKRLNTSHDIPNILNYNIETFIYYISILLCYIYLFKIAKFITYNHILKLHFYLLYHYEKYRIIVEDNTFLKDPYLLYTFVSDIEIFLGLLSKSNKKFISMFKNQYNLYLEYNPNQVESIKRQWLFKVYLRRFIHKIFFLKSLLKHLTLGLNFVAFHLSRLVYYIPYTLTVICLFYDLYSGTIFYTFYALLYLYLTNIVKKNT